MSGPVTTPAVEAFKEHRPSQWRSFANDALILRCCGQDFGNATRKLKRGDDGVAWDAWAEHALTAALPDLLAGYVQAAPIRALVERFDWTDDLCEFGSAILALLDAAETAGGEE